MKKLEHLIQKGGLKKTEKTDDTCDDGACLEGVMIVTRATGTSE